MFPLEKPVTICFEFAPADEPLFKNLLEQLRAAPEWSFIDREVNIRLVLDPKAVEPSSSK